MKKSKENIQSQTSPSVWNWIKERNRYSKANADRFKKTVAPRVSLKELIEMAACAHELKSGVPRALLEEIADRIKEKEIELD